MRFVLKLASIVGTFAIIVAALSAASAVMFTFLTTILTAVVVPVVFGLGIYFIFKFLSIVLK